MAKPRPANESDNLWMIVYTRLTRDERSALERMAEMERRTLANMVRIAVIEALTRRGLVVVPECGEANNAPTL